MGDPGLHRTRSSGRPTQISRTVRGTKREAQRVAATLESRPRRTPPVARSPTCWPRGATSTSRSGPSRRDVTTRAGSPGSSPILIAAMPVARLGVADVERWHTRMRKTGVGEAAIRSRHSVLRAALAQALRWGWVGGNPASQAVLRQPSVSRAMAMTAEDVRAAIAAAHGLDPAAGVALRLAAVAGLRRAELAALRWDDLAGNELTVDSSATIVRGDGESLGRRRRHQDGQPPNRRARRRDGRRDRCSSASSGSRSRRASSPRRPGRPTPIGSDGGGRERGSCPGSTASGVFTICGTGPRPPRSRVATTCAPSPVASATPTRR